MMKGSTQRIAPWKRRLATMPGELFQAPRRNAAALRSSSDASSSSTCAAMLSLFPFLFYARAAKKFEAVLVAALEHLERPPRDLVLDREDGARVEQRVEVELGPGPVVEEEAARRERELGRGPPRREVGRPGHGRLELLRREVPGQMPELPRVHERRVVGRGVHGVVRRPLDLEPAGAALLDGAREEDEPLPLELLHRVVGVLDLGRAEVLEAGEVARPGETAGREPLPRRGEELLALRRLELREEDRGAPSRAPSRARRRGRAPRSLRAARRRRSRAGPGRPRRRGGPPCR